MAKRAPVRKPFVMTVAMLATACGAKFDVAPSEDTGASSDADVTDTATSETEPGGCPRSAPAVGTACTGTDTCNYPRCMAPTWQGDIVVQCVAGAWRESGVSSCNPPPPDPPCPATEPRVGEACTRPGYSAACTYPDKCSPAGVKGYACESGAWKLTTPTSTSACPATAPKHGSPCLCVSGTCTYGDCYGTPTIYATCDAATGTWQALESTCNPPPPPLDGGMF